MDLQQIYSVTDDLDNEIKASSALKFSQYMVRNAAKLLRVIIVSGVVVTLVCLTNIIPYEILIVWLLPFIPFWLSHEIQDLKPKSLANKYKVTEVFVRGRIDEVLPII